MQADLIPHQANIGAPARSRRLQSESVEVGDFFGVSLPWMEIRCSPVHRRLGGPYTSSARADANAPLIFYAFPMGILSWSARLRR